MQWNRLTTMKLALAGLLLALAAGDSLARPGLFGRWRNQSEPYYNNQSQYQYQPVQQVQGVQQPVQQVQGAQPMPAAQPQPVVQQPVVQQPVVQQQTAPQYTTTRRGLFGRRTQQVVQTPVQQTAPATGTTTTPNDNRQSFYPAPAGTQSFIEVRLPVADAQVNFNGTATTQSGNNRLFVTPALEAQRDNVYQVTARWTVNGAPVEQQREIKVAPGSRVVVDFTQAQAQQPQGQQPPAVIQPAEQQPAPAPQP